MGPMDATAKTVGRPPLAPELLEEIERLLADGVPPSQVSYKTAVGLTKVYEVRRRMGKAATVPGAAPDA